jgi:phytoene/squalene synthetase
VDAVADPAIGQACAPLVARAQAHFAESEAIMAKCPRRVVRTPRIMAAAYRLILARVVARGFAPPRLPIKLRRVQFLWILLRYAIV